MPSAPAAATLPRLRHRSPSQPPPPSVLACSGDPTALCPRVLRRPDRPLGFPGSPTYMAREDYYLGRLPDSPAMLQSSLPPTGIATTIWVFHSLSIPSSCLPDLRWLDPTAPTGRATACKEFYSGPLHPLMRQLSTLVMKKRRKQKTTGAYDLAALKYILRPDHDDKFSRRFQVNNCEKELEEMKHMPEFLDPSEGRAEVFQEVHPFTVE